MNTGVKCLNGNIDKPMHGRQSHNGHNITCKTTISISFSNRTLSQEQGLRNYTILPYMARMNGLYN